MHYKVCRDVTALTFFSKATLCNGDIRRHHLISERLLDIAQLCNIK